MLCFIGLRIQFITYNKRRRIRKFFSPVGGRIAGFLSRHVAQPTAGAWNEFHCICGEIKAKAGVGATFSRHRGFFAGVVNVVLPLICIGALTAVISAVMSLPHALEVTCNGKDRDLRHQGLGPTEPDTPGRSGPGGGKKIFN